MKKSLIFLPLAVVALAGCSGANEAKADDVVPIGTQIQDLIKSFIDENGQYTKKTTICFNDKAHDELDKYFHNGATEAKRTTYYNDNSDALLMAEGLGNLDLKTKYTDSGYGGYRLVDGKVYRFVAKDTEGTFENMFNPDYMFTKGQASYGNIEHLSDVFVNLSKLAADDYFDDTDWGYTDDVKQYYHDLDIPKGKTELDDRYYPDILGFAAPMLKTNYIGSEKKYIHIKSIGISEKYDTDANKYLSIKIYLDDNDSGKVTGECGVNVMSEARIYKGIKSPGEEDFSEGYFLRVWDENNAQKSMTKLSLNTENDKELLVKGVKFSINDHAKLWSTKRGFDIAQDYKYSHNLSIGVPITDTGDYVAKNAGTYDFYAKFTDSSLETYESTWVNMNEVRTIYLENNWYKESTDFKIYYWGGEGVTGTDWDYAPSLVWDSNTGKDIYRAVIPANVEKVIFRHANWEGATQTVDITLGDNNAYYFDKIENGKTKVGSYKK